MRWLAPAAICALLLAALPGGAPANASDADAAFPRPEGLEADIAFWRRVYTEVDTRSGFIHDSRRLDIVYETVELPANIGPSARQQRVDRIRSRYRSVLRRLSTGRRTGLSDEELRVLSLWPEDVTGKELIAASERLRFQLGQSDRFLQGLIRSGKWLPYIVQVFAERGLPPELAYLPHVESSFNPDAYSHAAAAGLWQFTPYTGRLFMQIDHVVDERLDPFAATVAAARLLESNYRETGSWPLALTGYNHGIAGMKRAARSLGTSDIETIVRTYRSPSFGFASRNFYVSFLAALDVERDAQRYFGAFERQAVLDIETVELDAFLSVDTVAEHLGLSREVLRALNPALRRPVWNGEKYLPSGYALRVPSGYGAEHARSLLAALPPGQRHTRQTPDHEHRIAAGETLSQIAARYGVSTSAIVQMNGLRSAHRIRAGQLLRLPGDADAPSMPAPRVAAAAPAADGVHRVRRGETLSAIASRYGISERAIAAANSLSNKHRIYVGQQLALPGRGGEYSVVGDAPDSYRVRSGDTLSRIARRFGVAENELATLNGLVDRHRLQIGQLLLLRAPQTTQADTSPPATSMKLAHDLTDMHPTEAPSQ